MRILPHTREELQALPLCDLTQLAHDMSRDYPGRYPTPDYAWRQIRLMIEPMTWDIRDEANGSGRWYVAYWAGEAIAMRPWGVASEYDAICKTMQAFFDETYPRTLTAPRWNPHYVVLEARDAN